MHYLRAIVKSFLFLIFQRLCRWQKRLKNQTLAQSLVLPLP
jgi:hypothetical protein